MKNPLFKGIHIDKDGGFQTLVTPEGQKKIADKRRESPAKKEEQKSNNPFGNKTSNVSISIVANGDHVISRKTVSDVEPAETIVALVRALVGTVGTAAAMYRLDPEELMDKAQRMVEEEFNNFINSNE